MPSGGWLLVSSRMEDDRAIVEIADTGSGIPAEHLEEGRLHVAYEYAYASELLPGLSGEIIEAVSCRYTMTPDEHFIIDRHPAHPQIVIASPCSGHGFKFGAVIGRVLADLALHGTTAYDIARFRLDRPALRAVKA